MREGGADSGAVLIEPGSEGFEARTLWHCQPAGSSDEASPTAGITDLHAVVIAIMFWRRLHSAAPQVLNEDKVSRGQVTDAGECCDFG